MTLIAEYEGATPSRIKIRKEVATKLKAKENLVVIKHVYTKFGSQKAKIITHIYNNEDEMKKLEHDVLLKKHQSKEEAAEKAPAE